MSDSGAGLILVVIGVGLLYLGAWLGGSIRQQFVDDWWQHELARRGVAHYYLDADNKRQWDWKKPAEAKP